MAMDGCAKKLFVLAFDAGHFHHLCDAVVHAEFTSAFSGVYVFLHVLTLEPTREIHRHKPAGDVAGRTEASADGPENHLAKFVRRSVQFRHPSLNIFAMLPFFVLDLFNVGFFG